MAAGRGEQSAQGRDRGSEAQTGKGTLGSESCAHSVANLSAPLWETVGPLWCLFVTKPVVHGFLLVCRVACAAALSMHRSELPRLAVASVQDALEGKGHGSTSSVNGV